MSPVNRNYHPIIHRIHRLLRNQFGAVALGAVFVAFASITMLTVTSVVAQTMVSSTQASQVAEVDSSLESRGADVRAKLIAQETELDSTCDPGDLACASLESAERNGQLITARLRGEHSVLRNDTSQDVTLRQFEANYIAGFDENGDPVWVDETGTRPHRFTQVVASGDRVTALDQDGRAWSWGANHAGQAGTGDFIEAREPTPVDVPDGRDEPVLFETLARGVDNSVCGIESGSANPADAGTLWCWGYNSDGQFGIGDAAVGKYFPTPVTPDTTLRFRDVEMSANTVCAITPGDDLYCWGGLPGTGPAITKPASTPVLTNVADVAMDANTVVTVSTGGQLRNWARGPLGQDGTDGGAQMVPAAFIGGGGPGSTAVIIPAGQPPSETDNPDNPVVVDVPGKVFEKVYVAPEETGLVKTLACALTADGEAWCWGEGSKGQLGNNANSDSPTPVKVNASSIRLGELALSSSSVAAVTSDGRLMAWGDGSKGQVGNRLNRDTPAPGSERARFVDQFSGRSSDYVMVEAATGNKGSFCALSDTGRVDCWGNNDNLQAGKAGSQIVATPTPVAIDTTASDIAAGDQFAVAAGKTDTWAWGRNSHGQLGRAVVSDPQEPAPVARAAHRYEPFIGYVPGGEM